MQTFNRTLALIIFLGVSLGLVMFFLQGCSPQPDLSEQAQARIARGCERMAVLYPDLDMRKCLRAGLPIPGEKRT